MRPALSQFQASQLCCFSESGYPPLSIPSEHNKRLETRPSVAGTQRTQGRCCVMSAFEGRIQPISATPRRSPWHRGDQCFARETAPTHLPGSPFGHSNPQRRSEHWRIQRCRDPENFRAGPRGFHGLPAGMIYRKGAADADAAFWWREVRLQTTRERQQLGAFEEKPKLLISA